MKSFILDWMHLPTEKCYYTPCKNGIGMFGNEDLKFNMFALYVNFMSRDVQTDVLDLSCLAYAFNYLPVSANSI